MLTDSSIKELKLKKIKVGSGLTPFLLSFRLHYFHCVQYLFTSSRVCKKLMEHAVPLSQLQPFHVVCYEHKLIPVILTHCQYSLQYGRGDDVTYDLQAIERDLCDKFIFGKPLILYDEVPRVVLRKDAHDIAFYESIAAKVPQVTLQQRHHNLLCFK